MNTAPVPIRKNQDLITLAFFPCRHPSSTSSGSTSWVNCTKSTRLVHTCALIQSLVCNVTSVCCVLCPVLMFAWSQVWRMLPMRGFRVEGILITTLITLTAGPAATPAASSYLSTAVNPPPHSKLSVTYVLTCAATLAHVHGLTVACNTGIST